MEHFFFDIFGRLFGILFGKVFGTVFWGTFLGQILRHNFGTHVLRHFLVLGCTWLSLRLPWSDCVYLGLLQVTTEGFLTHKPISGTAWMDWDGSLNASLLRAPLCGANKNVKGIVQL